MSNRVVVSHELDRSNPAAPVYRLIHGVPVYTMVPGEDGDPVEVLDRYDELHDTVFDASDARWRTGDGEQRPLEEVAAEQRALVAEAVDERSRTSSATARARAAATTQLPGVGTPL